MRTQTDQRSDERVEVMLPVHLQENSGTTHNFSASGVCFETDGAYPPGSEIDFVLEIDTFSEKKLLRCKGTVVRTTASNGKISVAASITESRLEPAASS
jgi:hypothetical protein